MSIIGTVLKNLLVRVAGNHMHVTTPYNTGRSVITTFELRSLLGLTVDSKGRLSVLLFTKFRRTHLSLQVVNRVVIGVGVAVHARNDIINGHERHDTRHDFVNGTINANNGTRCFISKDVLIMNRRHERVRRLENIFTLSILRTRVVSNLLRALNRQHSLIILIISIRRHKIANIVRVQVRIVRLNSTLNLYRLISRQRYLNRINIPHTAGRSNMVTQSILRSVLRAFRHSILGRVTNQ